MQRHSGTFDNNQVEDNKNVVVSFVCTVVAEVEGQGTSDLASAKAPVCKSVVTVVADAVADRGGRARAAVAEGNFKVPLPVDAAISLPSIA